MQKIKCGNCSHIFTAREAKCIDWQDPKKNFICPSCDKALKPVDVKKAIVYKHIAIQAGLGGFLMAFFGALAKNVTGNTLYIIIGGTLVIVFGIAHYFKKPIQPVERYPYEGE